MSTEESTSNSASSEFTPQAIGTRSAKAKTPRQRAPRRGGTRPKDLEPDVQRRLRELQEKRTHESKEKINLLNPGQKHALLEKVLTRLPGLMFDILSLMEVPQPPYADPEGLHWCVCGHCRDMTTDIEKVCCRQTHEHCISNMAYMAYYVLDEGVLRLARGAWNDIFAINDHQEPGEEQRQYRHSAYRQFVLWQHGRLGIGNRVVIPSCCVWKIRDCFPDPRGQYTGFRVTRHV
ncbi:P2X purinoceptor 7-like isoform X2 [Pimephales promelas]|uniref:P2X purinoceptor 7-like isoform X2 n=1 Tax=Pimephales promelas TaxID=90988 RepID=UPI001955A984|nr:P2X purinoceptor 7-like isoform X2 [Pimephales promelas]XP_039550913.1 P2X purinoceptor 7-like isoform X2 [Pimephales promelas]